MSKKHVLILCTGNSARSQMAEGLVNHFLGERWRASSAGTQPTGRVHPLAIQAMAEIGVDISHHRSKSADEFREVVLDLVVTVCDEAAENCPVWLGAGRSVHLGFPDPARVRGPAAEQLAAFRQVRDGLRQCLLVFLREM
ncbi:MAG: arsenate reductase ArsC [Chloroflexota bacterium]